MPIEPAVSVDGFLKEGIRIRQPRRGYRFSLDAPLLAHFVRTRPGDRVLEFGTGTGIVPLLLYFRKPFSRLVGLEIQSRLAGLASHNVRDNGAGDRIGIVRADLRSLPFRAGSFDIVISNPPYRKFRSGRINPDPEKAVARHEICMSLEDLFRAAAWALAPGGRLELVHRAERVPEIEAGLRREGFRLARAQYVYSFAGDPRPQRVLVSAGNGVGGPAEWLPPLVIRAGPGRYTELMQKVLDLEEDGALAP